MKNFYNFGPCVRGKFLSLDPDPEPLEDNAPWCRLSCENTVELCAYILRYNII